MRRKVVTIVLLVIIAYYAAAWGYVWYTTRTDPTVPPGKIIEQRRQPSQ